MIPTAAIVNSVTALVAADSTKLGEAAVKNVNLIIEPFTPGPGTDLSTLDIATFDGYAAKSSPSGAQSSFTDPVTGRRMVQMIPPAGGWHWETTGTTDLPQTVYGYVVTKSDDSATYGSATFPEPITLTAADQSVDIPEIRLVSALDPLG